MRATPQRWISALADRRFRTLLLGAGGIPILLGYIWQALVLPVLAGHLGDLQESFLRAAATMHAGNDPYDLCKSMGCLEPTGPQYVTPPLLAWLLQPVASLEPPVLVAAAVVILNLCVALFLIVMLRALQVTDWQLATLLILTTVAFEPTYANVQEGQINLVLLALSAFWFSSWLAGTSWGGAAIAAAIALKLIQAPIGLLIIWARRWGMLGISVVVGLALLVVAVPRYLIEYLTSVLPVIDAGTGFFENHSPGGTVTRLLAPDSFFGTVHGSPPAARLITLVIALVAIGATFLVLRSPSTTRTGRMLEAAAVVALAPLVTSYSWGTHLVLLLLPMVVLITWGVRIGDPLVLGLVAAGWLSIGPAHKWFQSLLTSGYTNLVVLRLMAEFGVAGIVLIWAASLLAVRRQRSTTIHAMSASVRAQSNLTAVNAVEGSS